MSGLREHIAKDGTKLQRRYIYLEPHTWALLALLSAKLNLPQSQILNIIIAKAGGETINDRTELQATVY